MKILVGVYTPDGGDDRGRRRGGRLPQRPRRRARPGVGMVFQEFSLVPTLTVAQNVFLTREPRDAAGSSTTARWSAGPRELLRGAWRSTSTRAGRVRAADGLLAADRDRQGPLAGRPRPDLRRADRRARQERDRAPLRPHATAAGARHLDRLHLAPHGGDLRDLRPRSRSCATGASCCTRGRPS